MNKEKIKIIQNILKKENRYNMALLLENSYYEDYIIDNWNGSIGQVNIFVHPNNYLPLSQLQVSEHDLLIKLFDGLPHKYFEINSLIFTINTDITIDQVNDAVYIFVDEAGDMDFSSKGSKYYMFNFLIKHRPFNLHETIANYRYALLERNFDPRNEKDRFYIDNLNFAIHKLLDELDIQKNFIIITDRLPVQKNKKRQVGALKKGIKEYIKTKQLNIRYDIFHHCSASSVNLQIVDYISWAIFRKYEQGEDNFYKKIEKYLIKVDEMTKDREVSHYEK